MRDVSRSSRSVARVAMDACGVRLASASPAKRSRAYGEIVWSWRRDPGVYPACPCGLGNGGKKGRSPGRARISRQTSRGEGRDVSTVPVVFRPCASAHGMPVCSRARDLRAQSAPGLPCASLERRGATRSQNPDTSRRGNAGACLTCRELTGASPKAAPSSQGYAIEVVKSRSRNRWLASPAAPARC